MSLSSKGEAAVLAPLITNAFVSLHTADPGDTGANEVSGGGYARQGPVAYTESGANPTVAANSAIITWGAALAPWGTITHFGNWDSITGGNFRGSGAMVTPKPISTGDLARFAAGMLTITVD